MAGIIDIQCASFSQLTDANAVTIDLFGDYYTYEAKEKTVYSCGKVLTPAVFICC